MTADIVAIETTLREALIAYATDLNTCAPWYGKENDCVNRFALGFLLPRGTAASVLRHPTQLGIEVGVPQPPGIGSKAAARKDLVIWPEPWMSCWDSAGKPVARPVAILEWKVVHGRRLARGTSHDRDWLAAFARWQSGFVGLSVHLMARPATKPQLVVARFRGNDYDPGWLRL
jgi:hypothetical protein